MKMQGVQFFILRPLAHLLQRWADIVFKQVGDEQGPTQQNQAHTAGAVIESSTDAFDEGGTRLIAPPMSDMESTGADNPPAHWLARVAPDRPPAHWLARVGASFMAPVAPMKHVGDIDPPSVVGASFMRPSVPTNHIDDINHADDEGGRAEAGPYDGVVGTSFMMPASTIAPVGDIEPTPAVGAPFMAPAVPMNHVGDIEHPPVVGARLIAPTRTIADIEPLSVAPTTHVGDVEHPPVVGARLIAPVAPMDHVTDVDHAHDGRDQSGPYDIVVGADRRGDQSGQSYPTMSRARWPSFSLAVDGSPLQTSLPMRPHQQAEHHFGAPIHTPAYDHRSQQPNETNQPPQTRWPSLPEQVTPDSQDWDMTWRAWERQQRLNEEQRGNSWNV